MASYWRINVSQISNEGFENGCVSNSQRESVSIVLCEKGDPKRLKTYTNNKYRKYRLLNIRLIDRLQMEQGATWNNH